MKTLPLVLAGWITFRLVFTADAGPSLFIAQVNSAWTSGDHAEILRLVDVAKASPPIKPEVYAVSFGYSIFVLSDRPRATADLDDLIASVSPTATQARTALQQYRAGFVSLPAQSATGRTPAQLAQLHSVFPNEFPINNLLLAIAAGP